MHVGTKPTGSLCKYGDTNICMLHERRLFEMELVPERASRLSSACLLLAFIIKGLGGWVRITHAQGDVCITIPQ